MKCIQLWSAAVANHPGYLNFAYHAVYEEDFDLAIRALLSDLIAGELGQFTCRDHNEFCRASMISLVFLLSSTCRKKLHRKVCALLCYSHHLGDAHGLALGTERSKAHGSSHGHLAPAVHAPVVASPSMSTMVSSSARSQQAAKLASITSTLMRHPARWFSACLPMVHRLSAMVSSSARSPQAARLSSAASTRMRHPSRWSPACLPMVQ